MNRECFLVRTIALAAQSVRDVSGLELCAAVIQPVALLQQLEQALACAHLLSETHRVMVLRESIEAECLGSPVCAALVLLDVCEALELNEADTRRALSLADWCDVQRVLSHEFSPTEVRTMSP
jgi:hypothetical protein